MKTDIGFTLIELLVVIAIICILAGIAITSYNSFMIKGRLSECNSYLTAIATAERRYARENYAYTGSDETEDSLFSKFNIKLSESRNFCYKVVLQNIDGTIPSNGWHFKIYAYLLNNQNTLSSSGTCTKQTGTAASDGWVNPAGSNITGTEGDSVILCYPPPPNGLAVQCGLTNSSLWEGGITVYDVFK